MTTAIQFPLVAQVLISYLNEGEPQQVLASVPDVSGNAPVECVVQSEVPNPRPPRLIALFTLPTGGAQIGPTLSERRICCQVYEDSEFVTAQLTEKARGLVVDSKYRGLGIKRVKVIGEPARFPGPGVPWRWQFTADVLVRAFAGPWH